MSSYADGFLAGQVVAYCEMVNRGVRLTGHIDVPEDACSALVSLVKQEGCLARVDVGEGGRAVLWIYRDPDVESLIVALCSPDFPMPSAVAIWGMGKLFGYGDRDVLTFLGSTSASVEEPSPRHGSDSL